MKMIRKEMQPHIAQHRFWHGKAPSETLHPSCLLPMAKQAHNSLFFHLVTPGGRFRIKGNAIKSGHVPVSGGTTQIFGNADLELDKSDMKSLQMALLVARPALSETRITATQLTAWYFRKLHFCSASEKQGKSYGGRLPKPAPSGAARSWGSARFHGALAEFRRVQAGLRVAPGSAVDATWADFQV